MKNISLIIITYNRPGDLLELLQDISKLEDMEGLLKDVIIVNNASTINYSVVTDFIVNNPSIPFRYIESKENLGVAKGRNYAVQFAEGDILAFFDDDILMPDRTILSKMLKAFGNTGERETGIISFKVLYHSTGEMQINAFPHKKFAEYKDKPSFLTYYYIGCAHALKKEVWQKAGNYPEDFFYGMEEYDLGYRVLDAGYSIGYNNSIVVRHKESPLGRKPKSEQLRMMWVNKSKVAWKYLPVGCFLTTIVMWSMEYLKKAGSDIKNYFRGWKEIYTIPSTQKRTPLKNDTLKYLRNTDARLWY